MATGSVASGGGPSDVRSMMYSFEPNSVVRVESRSGLSNGVSCTGFGQFRINGNEVLVFIQATSSADCPLPAFIDLGKAEVQAARLQFTNSTTGDKTFLWPVQKVSSVAPVGLWSFHGQAGFDWAYFDPYGYFLLQATIDQSTQLLVGYYAIHQGALAMVFFPHMDPAQASPDIFEFNQFMTDGATLALIQQNGAQKTTLVGERF